jgi:serine/threonine protein kinase
MTTEGFDASDREQHFQEVLAAYLQAVEAGQHPDQSAWLKQHPDVAEEMRSFFANHNDFGRRAEPLSSTPPTVGPGAAGPPRNDPNATTAHVPEASAPSESAANLLQVLHQYLADVQAGQRPNPAQLVADHPELAAQLGLCLAGMEFIQRAAQDPENTQTRLGDFLILREVGRGGMGVVYEAEQVSLKRRVALKVLNLGPVGDAEAIAQLHHTHVVPIFAVGCDRGVHYYAMQFIDGTNLATALAATCQAGAAPFDCLEVARWGLQAAEALAYAHQRGVIHRDVKPSNLLLDQQGTLWLTDFGLARRLDDVAQTATDLLLGTPRYIAPSRLPRQSSRSISAVMSTASAPRCTNWPRVNRFATPAASATFWSRSCTPSRCRRGKCGRRCRAIWRPSSSNVSPKNRLGAKPRRKPWRTTCAISCRAEPSRPAAPARWNRAYAGCGSSAAAWARPLSPRWPLCCC